MLTCNIYMLPDSPHPVINGKNPRFRVLYLARRNEFRFFRLIKYKKKYFSFIFGCWLVASARKKLAFARKMMAMPVSGSFTNY